eukprot:2330660-Rhodomonas_salina.3
MRDQYRTLRSTHVGVPCRRKHIQGPRTHNLSTVCTGRLWGMIKTGPGTQGEGVGAGRNARGR